MKPLRRSNRLIVVAVAGNTPAIITETLWALEQQQQLQVDEIRVITTTPGKRAIEAELLGPEGHFSRYCQDYQVPPGRIAFSPRQIYVLQDAAGEELEDIRTNQENASAADQIFALLQEWTARPEEIIHGSVAGGRKTLGIYLAAALMLCGRPEDRLSHVLVDPRFESGVSDFYYPPPTPRTFHKIVGQDATGKALVENISSEQVSIDLAEIPFLRLQELVGGKLPIESGYLEAIRHSQALCKYLKDPPIMEICQPCGHIQLGEFSLHLPKQQLAVYLFLLNECSGDKGLTLSELYARRARLAALERHLDRLRLGEHEQYAWEAMEGLEDFRDKLSPIISKINQTFQNAIGDNRVARYFMIQRQPRYRVAAGQFQLLEQPCRHGKSYQSFWQSCRQ
ncbi:MAG: CRISPR-associated ring nuclease Csm6 [Desulfobacteraceae bacterium]